MNLDTNEPPLTHSPKALSGSLATLAVFATTTLSAQKPAVQGPILHTYAPSPSTQREAARLLRLCRWTDTATVRDADALLVVVRTARVEPLSVSYANLKWLRDDAHSLLNESGPQFHVYIYSIRSDLSVTQADHRSYDFAEPGIRTEVLDRTHPVARGGFGCPF